jgi:isonocardicin synthase
VRGVQSDESALVAQVSRRAPVRLHKRHDEKPFDLFIARAGWVRWVGCKTPAPLREAGPPVKSCLIDASMIHGLLEQVQVSSAGVTIYLRPANEQESVEAFHQLVSSPENDIQYPFTRIDIDGRLDEPVTTSDYWVPTPERVRELDDAEAPLRAHTVEVLRRYGIGGGRVFDPACSTGAFLVNVREHFPAAWTIGQDQSDAMLKYAGPHLDEVHHGDSVLPRVPPASIDVLALRFLNVDVVPTQRALQLFDACARTVAPGGLVLVMGHTPVLVPSAYFEESGFQVLGRHGVTPGGRAAFQFYVLRKDFTTRAGSPV